MCFLCSLKKQIAPIAMKNNKATPRRMKRSAFVWISCFYPISDSVCYSAAIPSVATKSVETFKFSYEELLVFSFS